MESSSPLDFPSPKPSVTKRYQFAWRLLLISNFALGAYIFARPKKRNTKKTATAKVPVEAEEEEQHITDTSSEISAPEENLEPVAVVAPVRILQPIPEEQQRELFKWMLDEKRKTKPKDAQEKRKIDQEKAVLKDFIRSESIPSLYTESVATD